MADINILIRISSALEARQKEIGQMHRILLEMIKQSSKNMMESQKMTQMSIENMTTE